MKQSPLIENLTRISSRKSDSPRGNFSVQRKEMSQALGHPVDGGLWNGGHPFEVEHVTVTAGKCNFPFHAHAATWEFYWVLSGEGTARTGDEMREIHAGDFLMCLPGEAHQLCASEGGDLVYLVVTNNTMADLIYYPDSRKWNAKPDRRVFRECIDYYDGEE